MTKLYFEEMMLELGCHVEGTFAFGVQDAFPFSVEFDREEEGLFFLVQFVAEGDVKPVAKELSKTEMSYTRWSAEKEDDGQGTLVAVVRPASDFYVKSTLRSVIMAAGGALHDHGIKPIETCALCQKTECDRFAFIEGGCRPVHKNCLAEKLDLPEKDRALPKTVKGYVVTGIIGALLGALVAALPNWAQALSKGSINTVLYAFLPFLSALLYRLFRGKANLLLSGVVVLLSSLVVAFGMELVWYWLIITAQAGYNMPLSETTALYLASHSVAASLREMLFSLLFLVVGFFPAAVILRRYVAAGTKGGGFRRGAAFVRGSAFSLQEGKVLPDIPRQPLANDDPQPEIEPQQPEPAEEKE